MARGQPGAGASHDPPYYPNTRGVTVYVVPTPATPFSAPRRTPALDSSRPQLDSPSGWIYRHLQERVKYWLSNLPTQTPMLTPVRLPKLRRRVEHDHRELEQCLGLNHYEDRTFCGLHHHLTSVTLRTRS